MSTAPHRGGRTTARGGLSYERKMMMSPTSSVDCKQAWWQSLAEIIQCQGHAPQRPRTRTGQGTSVEGRPITVRASGRFGWAGLRNGRTTDLGAHGLFVDAP